MEAERSQESKRVLSVEHEMQSTLYQSQKSRPVLGIETARAMDKAGTDTAKRPSLSRWSHPVAGAIVVMLCGPLDGGVEGRVRGGRCLDEAGGSEPRSRLRRLSGKRSLMNDTHLVTLKGKREQGGCWRTPCEKASKQVQDERMRKRNPEGPRPGRPQGKTCSTTGLDSCDQQ